MVSNYMLKLQASCVAAKHYKSAGVGNRVVMLAKSSSGESFGVFHKFCFVSGWCLGLSKRYSQRSVGSLKPPSHSVAQPVLSEKVPLVQYLASF